MRTRLRNGLAVLLGNMVTSARSARGDLRDGVSSSIQELRSTVAARLNTVGNLTIFLAQAFSALLHSMVVLMVAFVEFLLSVDSSAGTMRKSSDPPGAVLRLTSMLTRFLPRAVREVHAEDFACGLYDLAEAGAPRWRQLIYVLSLIRAIPGLRRAVRPNLWAMALVYVAVRVALWTDDFPGPQANGVARVFAEHIAGYQRQRQWMEAVVTGRVAMEVAIRPYLARRVGLGWRRKPR